MEIIDSKCAHWLTNVHSLVCVSFFWSNYRLITLYSNVTEKGRLWRTPEWATSCRCYGCIPSEALAVTVLNVDWRVPFCCSSNKAHSWVPAVLSWIEVAYVLLLSSQKSWVLSLFTSIYIASWRMCYSAFSALNVYFRRFITSFW